AAVFAPPQDAAEDVAGTRIGRIGGRLAGSAALAVVSERDVHLAGGRMHGDPFRPVHPRGADNVAGQARMDQHLGLVGKAAFPVDAVAAMPELDPPAAAAVVEAR